MIFGHLKISCLNNWDINVVGELIHFFAYLFM
jgi:hypothetical protein